jgi:hypothetical protein
MAPLPRSSRDHSWTYSQELAEFVTANGLKSYKMGTARKSRKQPETKAPHIAKSHSGKLRCTGSWVASCEARGASANYKDVAGMGVWLSVETLQTVAGFRSAPP